MLRVIVTVWTTWLASGTALAAAPRVSMELATEDGLAITGSQQWYQTLTELGVEALQIRSATRRDKPAVTSRAVAGGTAHHVLGVIAADGKLHLPGGTYSTRDADALKKWLAKLADLGEEGVTGPRLAFDLVPSQLELVRKDLAAKVGVQSVGQPAATVLAKLQRTLKFPLVLDPGAKEALAEVTLEDELSGLTTGTALAALARPAGLVLRPERPPGGKLQYRLGKPRKDSQAWPVGWEPEESPGKVLPELFQSINVEIADTPLAEVVQSISQRVKAPALYDRNSLAAKEIDPAAVKVSLPAKKMPYALVLRKVTSQVGLAWELRIDEANRPFFWITAN